MCPSMQTGGGVPNVTAPWPPSNSVLAWYLAAIKPPGLSLALRKPLLTRGFDCSLFRPSLGHNLHFHSLPLWGPLSRPLPAPCFRRCPRRSFGQQGLAQNLWPTSAAVTAWWAPPPPTLDLYVLSPSRNLACSAYLPHPTLPCRSTHHPSLHLLLHLLPQWVNH